MLVNNHIFLSPHLDDAVLSCGGLIYNLSQSGENPLILTIFSGDVSNDQEYSPSAKVIHKLCGDSQNIVKTRIQEDIEAVKILHADFQHLDYLDCIYRIDEDSGDPLINSFNDIFQKDIISQKNLIQTIKNQAYSLFCNNNDVIVYAPLGVGGHIDHKIVNKIALELKNNNINIRFYEDYPYSEIEEDFVRAYKSLSNNYNLKLETVFLEKEAREAKQNSIKCYSSQINMLFQDVENVNQRVNDFINKNKGERYWSI